MTPGWFGIFHVPALRGRVFGDNDWKEGAPYNAVLTASLARKLFGTEDAVDRTLGGIFGRPALHVIGVVPNLWAIRRPTCPRTSCSSRTPFHPLHRSDFSLVMRNRVSIATVAERIRSALRAESFLTSRWNSRCSSRQQARTEERESLSDLLVLLSMLAAILAAVGLYGVIAFVVAGRRRSSRSASRSAPKHGASADWCFSTEL